MSKPPISSAASPGGGMAVPKTSPIFDAVLTPHRSLPPHGFLLLMVTIALLAFIGGAVFYLVGAWPVILFLGLDVLLIYLAFRYSYRSARRYERLELRREQLIVSKVDPWGRERRFALDPAWLQVVLEGSAERQNQLRLRSHGRETVIGSFLSPEEREDFAEALRAALDKARAPCLPLSPCAPA